ncbi:MAG: mechanosensitive ion channel [Alphaproteobacteria bacterium]|nr:mechanosensitive ion channel [Alphaproteobacteria bacterium]
MEVHDIIRQAVALLTVYGLKLIGAVLILIIGWMASSWAGRAAARLSRGLKRVDPTVAGFLASFIRYGLLTITLVAVLAQFGVETTSIIAVLGAAGLAIGLALQGTLSHFASGVMLLLFRPFRIGDTIEVAGQVGTAKAITLFTTELSTPDNVLLILPNGAVWGSVIKNFSAHRTRRVDVSVTIGYRNRIDSVAALVREILAADPRPLPAPEPQIVTGALTETGVQVEVRVWVNAADYWDFRYHLIRTIQERFADAGIELPLAQQFLKKALDAPAGSP